MRHFSDAELTCKHCGAEGCTDELKQALDDLRELAGVPIVVDDAFRCEEHNAAVGGVPHSEHPRGEAADIKIHGKTLQEMYDLARQIPAFANGGIGVYDGNFIHVDVRGQKARWSRVNGAYLGVNVLVA